MAFARFDAIVWNASQKCSCPKGQQVPESCGFFVVIIYHFKEIQIEERLYCKWLREVERKKEKKEQDPVESQKQLQRAL